MEMEGGTPARKLTRSENGLLFEKTPPQALQTVQKSDALADNGAPHPSNVPKAFSFPERYMSPTDRMISPISKGLLARNKKVGPLLPPKTPPKDLLKEPDNGNGLSVEAFTYSDIHNLPWSHFN